MKEQPGGRREVSVNGVTRLVSAASIPELLREVGHDPDRRGIAVAVDGEVVPRAEWARRPLRAGDRIEVVGAVQGG